MTRPTLRRSALALALAAATAATSAGLAAAQSGYGPAGGGSSQEAPAPTKKKAKQTGGRRRVTVNVFAPSEGDRVSPTGWFVDLAADYNTGLSRTGFSAPQLTGPAGHANVAPAPGAFGPGHDEHFPGLIVIMSTAKAGPGQNLAGLFNLTGLTNRSKGKAQLWSTWLVGAPNFGQNVASTVWVAIAADKNGNGVYDDAPDQVPDADGDGDVDAKDLKAFGVASNVETRHIFIGG